MWWQEAENVYDEETGFAEKDSLHSCGSYSGLEDIVNLGELLTNRM